MRPPLTLSLHAKTICFGADAAAPPIAEQPAPAHQQALPPGTSVDIHPAEPGMKLASGTTADLTALLAVPPGCRLRIRVAELPVPWSVAGLQLLDRQLQQRFAALCDDHA